MARKSTKKQEVELTLEQVLWNCRVALRGVGSMEKNRDAVISLVFLKFAGDKFNNRRKELTEQYGDIPVFLEKPSFYNAVNVFYLPEPARWTYLVDHAGDNAIATIIDNAMSEAEKANPSLRGALPLGLFATLGATKSSIKSLIDEIAKISEKRYHEEDLIGRVYEYFLQTFAVGSSKEDGEFYTPACVVQLIAELIEPYEGGCLRPVLRLGRHVRTVSQVRGTPSRQQQRNLGGRAGVEPRYVAPLQNEPGHSRHFEQSRRGSRLDLRERPA